MYSVLNELWIAVVVNVNVHVPNIRPNIVTQLSVRSYMNNGSSFFVSVERLSDNKHRVAMHPNATLILLTVYDVICVVLISYFLMTFCYIWISSCRNRSISFILVLVYNKIHMK